MFYKYNIPIRQLKRPDLGQLIPKVRVPVKPKINKLSSPAGPEGRLHSIGETVTGLLKYERIELNYTRAEESRQYAERLISEAIRRGPTDPWMMELADFYIKEKQVIHKLFKVLVPRFENMPMSYTRLFRAPNRHWSDAFYTQNENQYDQAINKGRPYAYMVKYPKALLELRGNPYPPVFMTSSRNPNLIQNVLLRAAKLEYKANDKCTEKSDEELEEETEDSENDETLAKESSDQKTV